MATRNPEAQKERRTATGKLNYVAAFIRRDTVTPRYANEHREISASY